MVLLLYEFIDRQCKLEACHTEQHFDSAGTCTTPIDGDCNMRPGSIKLRRHLTFGTSRLAAGDGGACNGASLI